MTRGLKIAVFSTSGAAGFLCAALLALVPAAGADEGTTGGTTTDTVTTAPSTGATTTAPPPVAQPKTIAAGVTVGGALVGGLAPAQARAILRQRFARPLTLVAGPGARITIAPQRLGASARLDEALALAARVKRPGFVVPLQVDVDRARVERFVARLGARFRRDPVDAELKLRNLVPFATKDVPGRRLKELIAAREIVKALKTHARDPLTLPFEQIAPAVSSDDLGRAIVIRRGSNRLFFYEVARRSKLIRAFKVATGLAQYPTPLGRFEVIDKQRYPWWYPPVGSDWAKDAKPIPPGPGNPLGTRWMGLSAPYVGIHGTPDAASVGYSASHGCIRMLIPQAEWLFSRVSIGTPVIVVAA
ncbi:L,D-transpeptidase catalytic domain-containing protein [Gaiella occulta]|uniref:L,D-transpeptidase catalytic domain-containing protein n=1 Tax=Gaiella occulta TaxID=1002870 RepID=A0A7M2YWR2_9ACTN|nr:L,D-transpeptidase family protein [Gaiella occulta]RDI73888.1 L,D-transpeptidase catalytic domain-containing protein [Gaiella occulta]